MIEALRKGWVFAYGLHIWAHCPKHRQFVYEEQTFRIPEKREEQVKYLPCHEAANTVNVSKAKEAVLLGLYAGALYADRWGRSPVAFTDEDIAYGVAQLSNLVGIHTEQSLRSRRAELERAGYVKCIDRLGRTSHGCACRRYALTDTGKKLAKQIYERTKQ